jgi:enoyl-CoA hydratase/carnithine racemase
MATAYGRAMTAWASSSGFVDIAHDEDAAIVTLRRSEKLNALTVPMLHDLAAALEAAAASSRGVVITGQGRAFSAGDDLLATAEVAPEAFEELLASFQTITRTILQTEVPVLAGLNGISVGGAAEITLACDARVGWERSDFLFPENDVGLTISNASTYLLPRLLGPRALPMVLDGRRISGTEAHALGLIDYMVESREEVVPKAVEVLKHWVSRGLATRFHLELLRPPFAEVERALERETITGRAAWDAGTAREGIARFVREQAAKQASRGS